MAVSGIIRVLERAARKAGSRLRRDFGEVEHLQVSRKGPADFVSKADEAAERILWDELRAARPDWGFLLEEAGEIKGDETKPRFIIDPLDGTTNFLHGMPHFAISIAVQEPKLGGGGWGEVTAALVYQPITDESFWAEKSRGAWLHDARLRVSARRDLSESLIATGIPFGGHGNFPEWHEDRGRHRSARRGYPPLRQRRARPRLGRRRPVRGISGKRASSRGTAPRAACWCARPAASSPTGAGVRCRCATRRSWPATTRCIRACTSCSSARSRATDRFDA